LLKNRFLWNLNILSLKIASVFSEVRKEEVVRYLTKITIIKDICFNRKANQPIKNNLGAKK